MLPHHKKQGRDDYIGIQNDLYSRDRPKQSSFHALSVSPRPRFFCWTSSRLVSYTPICFTSLMPSRVLQLKILHPFHMPGEASGRAISFECNLFSLDLLL